MHSVPDNFKARTASTAERVMRRDEPSMPFTPAMRFDGEAEMHSPATGYCSYARYATVEAASRELASVDESSNDRVKLSLE